LIRDNAPISASKCSSMSKTTESKLEHIASVVDSLKEITTIIVGLALTNSIIQFLVVGTTVKTIVEMSAVSTVVFVLLLINMIRFYHGNFRHLDVTYCCSSIEDEASGSIKHHPRGEKVPIDFLFILTESLMLSAISFYQAKLTYFFYGFVALLMVDAIWFGVTFLAGQYVPSRDVLVHQRNWAMNNAIAIILLLIVLSFVDRLPPDTATYVLSVILFANTLVDYKINWGLYFPSIRENEVEKKH
jgi:hypothetical protein